MKKRVFIIGLDGASFAVLRPLADSGALPNIKRLLEKGAFGDLCSTTPPITGPAWASFMTGKLPGKHGVYDFVRPVKGGVGREVISYNAIKSETIFDILTEKGKKTGAVNVPLTYPFPTVDGYVVAGLLTPKSVESISSPAGLIDEIRGEIGEYVMDVWWERFGKDKIGQFLDRLRFCTEQRIKAIRHVQNRLDWDFFITVFIGTDRIQHWLWDYIVPEEAFASRSAQDREINRLVVDYYKRIDKYLGEVMDSLDERTTLLVISDHGFGPLKGKVYINEWLAKKGYLTFDKSKLSELQRQSEKKQKLKRVIKAVDVFDLWGRFASKMIKKNKRLSFYSFLHCIDWQKTRAYSASNTEQGIYLNVKGREPEGIITPGEEFESVREGLMEELAGYRDEESGELMVSRIHKGGDVYSGPYLDEAPDIVFFLRDFEYIADVQPSERIFAKRGWDTSFGTHRFEGILMAYGSDIRAGEVTGARLVDIAPTLLNVLGLPINDDMDGCVLKDIFTKSFQKNHKPSYVSPGGGKDTVESGYDSDEAADVESQLKGLGYL